MKDLHRPVRADSYGISGHRAGCQHGQKSGIKDHTTHRLGGRVLVAGRELMSYEEQLRAYILKNFMYSGDARELTDDLPLFDRGIIDSTGVLDLVAYIEETFAVQVADAELLPENFATVAAIAAYLRSKTAPDSP